MFTLTDLTYIVSIFSNELTIVQSFSDGSIDTIKTDFKVNKLNWLRQAMIARPDLIKFTF